MTYRWYRPEQPSKSACFATKEEARDNAVFNSMISDGRTKAGQSGSARFKRLSGAEIELVWRSLLRAGWRIEAVV